MRAQFSRPLSTTQSALSAPQADSPFKPGQRVGHAKFGSGIVLQIEGDGAQQRAYVNFDSVGKKWLMLSMANLQSLA